MRIHRFYSAAAIVCGGCNRNHVVHHIDTNAFAFFINIWEMVKKFFFIEVPAIKINMFGTGTLHFVINCPGNNIAWCKVFARIISLHKRLTVFIAENAAIAANSFCYQNDGDMPGSYSAVG